MDLSEAGAHRAAAQGVVGAVEEEDVVEKPSVEKRVNMSDEKTVKVRM